MADAIENREPEGLFGSVLSWLSHTQLWKWVAGNIIAHFTFRWWSYPALPMENYETIQETLRDAHQRGPALYAWVQSDTASLAAVLAKAVTGGDYSHSGIVDPEDPTRVYHMKGKGMRHDHMLDVMKQTDQFALVRYELTPAEYDEMKARLADLRDRDVKYDYPMELEDFRGEEVEKIYCSEFIWHVGKGLDALG